MQTHMKLLACPLRQARLAQVHCLLGLLDVGCTYATAALEGIYLRRPQLKPADGAAFDLNVLPADVLAALIESLEGAYVVRLGTGQSLPARKLAVHVAVWQPQGEPFYTAHAVQAAKRLQRGIRVTQLRRRAGSPADTREAAHG